MMNKIAVACVTVWARHGYHFPLPQNSVSFLAKRKKKKKEKKINNDVTIESIFMKS